MSSHLLRQPSFAGGEISPFAYGHTESDAYRAGLSIAENFFPTLEGQLLNRAGTRYVAEVTDSAYAPRLIPFEFADGQTFFLEIGDEYIRILQNGAVTAAAVTGTVPWAIEDVDRLQYAQNGDVITFVCVNGTTEYAPQELTRVTNLDWVIAAASYSGVAANGSLVIFGVQSALHIPDPLLEPLVTFGAWDAGTNYAAVASHIIYGQAAYHSLQNGNLNHQPDTSPSWWELDTWTTNNGDQGAYSKNDYVYRNGILYISLQDGNINKDPDGGANPTWWAIAMGDLRIGRPWVWAATAVYRDENGATHESLPVTIAAPRGGFPRGTDRPVKIYVAAVVPDVATYTLIGHRFYVGQNGFYGFIAAVTTTQTSYQFTDDGAVPDYGIQPPRGTNPFDYATGANTKTQSQPGAFTFHDQRAIYARTNKRPQDFWGSAIGDYKRFDINTPVQASDAFNFRPASERLEEIRSLLSLRHLLLFTGSGVWTAEGAGEGEITATSVSLRRVNRKGASYLAPVVADEACLYQTNRGRIRDLVYDWRVRGYIGRDVSEIARHLFDGHNITDWTYAETPWSMFYAVRDDGTLLTLTYTPGGAAAWARHTTSGRFERVCSVVELDPVTGAYEDAVYVVVRRVIAGAVKRYIERFSSRVIPVQQATADDGTISFTKDVRRCNFLDSSLEYDGRADALHPGVSLRLVTLYDLGASGPAGVSDWTGGGLGLVESSAALFSAGDVGSSIVLDPDGDSPAELLIVYYGDATNVVVMVQSEPVDDDQPGSGPTGPWISDWGFGAQTITGLGHLEGQTVAVLADGAVAGRYTVQGGDITLGRPGVLVQIGLPYTSDMELLDVAADQIKTNVKSVRATVLEVVDSRGMKIGESLTNLSNPDNDAQIHEPQLQQVADGNHVPPLYSGNVTVVVASTWNVGARACVRQEDPLPVCIVAAVRELTIGGR
jgi:hypothetical protein